VTPDKAVNTSKQRARSRAFSYKGNALICEAWLTPAGRLALTHPNHVMARFRASNRGRQVA
jgi:hypothetical protein